MTNNFKITTAFMTMATGLALSQVAIAQDAYFGSNQDVSTTAGVHMTIPFGSKKSDRAVDKARFGLMLNMTHEYNDRNFYTPKRVNTNLLDFGMHFDGRPTMLISGEDMYTPLFAPLNAKGDDGGDINISKNTVLLAAGAALAVGAVGALAGGDDDDHDNDRDHHGPDDDF